MIISHNMNYVKFDTFKHIKACLNKLKEIKAMWHKQIEPILGKFLHLLGLVFCVAFVLTLAYFSAAAVAQIID